MTYGIKSELLNDIKRQFGQSLYSQFHLPPYSYHISHFLATMNILWSENIARLFTSPSICRCCYFLLELSSLLSFAAWETWNHLSKTSSNDTCIIFLVPPKPWSSAIPYTCLCSFHMSLDLLTVHFHNWFTSLLPSVWWCARECRGQLWFILPPHCLEDSGHLKVCAKLNWIVLRMSGEN